MLFPVDVWVRRELTMSVVIKGAHYQTIAAIERRQARKEHKRVMADDAHNTCMELCINTVIDEKPRSDTSSSHFFSWGRSAIS